MAFIITQEPFKLQAILRHVTTQNRTLLNSHKPEVIVERKQLISCAASDDPGTQVAASSILLGQQAKICCTSSLRAFLTTALQFVLT